MKVLFINNFLCKETIDREPLGVLSLSSAVKHKHKVYIAEPSRDNLHEKINKINKVTNNDGWTQFDYDKKGNLAKAQNDQGKAVLLIYDLKGRISKMVDTNKNKNAKRAITFKYNASGKPTEIAMSKVGKIDVTYDSYGEIKEVKSDAGPQMAMQVTQAFQNLLAIVRPAGVNLNM